MPDRDPVTWGAGAAPLVLHLRQSAGGGGGADAVLRHLMSRAVRTDRLRMAVAYLRKPEHEVGELVGPLRAIGIDVDEVPGTRGIDIGQFRRLAALVRNRRARIVHAHDPKSDILAWLLGHAIRHLATVSTVHGWTRKSAKDRLYERLDRWALRRLDRVIAVAGSVRGEAERAGIPGVVVVANGVDTEYFRPPIPASGRRGPFTVGFVGRLSPEKMPADFVRAVAGLAAFVPDARFVVAGDGPERGRAAALAASLGLDRRIEFRGMVAPADLPALYAGLDALVLCSRTEGMPMSLLEAGAMGLPVVATRVGGVAEVVEDGVTGLLAPAGDVEGIVRHLRDLHDRPGLASSMGGRARRRVEKRFSLDAAWRGYEAVYAELAAGPRA